MQKTEETTCQKEGNRILHVENRRNYMSNTRKKDSPCRKPKNHGDDSVRLLSHELEELDYTLLYKAYSSKGIIIVIFLANVFLSNKLLSQNAISLNVMSLFLQLQ